MTTYIWPQQSVSLAGAATEAKQDVIIGHIDGVEATLTAIAAKDFSTETTLAAAKLVLDSIDNGLPNALGRQAAAASTGVVLSTEDKASLDAVGTKLDSLIAKTAGALIPVAYDTIIPALGGATTDTYTYKTGGIAGTTVATLSINYTDATKVTVTSYVVT